MKADEEEAKKKYGIVAEHFQNWRTKIHPKGWIFNEFLENPCIAKLLGNIKGKKILDFGCGTGSYIKQMLKKGARIKGFDISPEMLKIAKKNYPKLELKLGSGYKIPFKEKFDIVLSQLVVEHIKDWDKIFKEVNRVLKKGGIFVFSKGNPITEITWKVSKKNPLIRKFDNYFVEKKNLSEWKNILHKGRAKKVRMPFYHKTYETIINLIIKNGFEIIGYKDCFPKKQTKKLFPKEYGYLSKVPFFCVWKVKKK
jgi:ubiquinone/menaquinone biosynthesis C-methylase UbiE